MNTPHTSESQFDLARERLKCEITEQICELLAEAGMSRAELARQLGRTPPYISKVLSGSQNFTVATISDLYRVLGYTPTITAVPIHESVQSMWDCCNGPQAPHRNSQGNQQYALAA